MIKLNQSPVIFIESDHTYWHGEMQLHGTSHLYGNHINPSKYDGISKEVLENAAKRGQRIHEECEMADRFGLAESTEAKNWVAIKEKHGITVVENEYLVSDLVYYATKIDKVIIVGRAEEGLIDLGDVKTTSDLDMESLSWQLSISAELFEQQNPHLKCRKLYAIWLRGAKQKFVEVPRKTFAEVLGIMEAEKNGYLYDSQEVLILSEEVNQTLQKVAELETLIQNTTNELKQKQSDMDTLKEFLMQQMESNGVKKLDTETLTITYVEPYSKELFDSKKFKEEQPDLAVKYIKQSQVKQSIKIKLK